MKEIDIETGEMVLKEGISAPFGYDPVKDLHPIDPFGFVNLREAYENHNVPTNVADEIVNYNGIEDPESMVGSARDIFEAYRMRDSLQKVRSAVESKDKGVSSGKDEN